MLNKDLIDITYDFVSDYFQKNKQSTMIDFKTIVDNLCKITNIKKDKFNEKIGSFYVDLLQDGRFLFLGENQWTLKDNVSNDFFKKNQNSLFSYDDSEAVIEVYDEDALPADMVNADNEVYEEDKNEISRDSFINDDDNNDSDDDEIVDIIEEDIDNEK